MFICVCIALCTIVAHNTAHSRPDNFPSYPPDNHHCSDDVCSREGRRNGAYHDCNISATATLQPWYTEQRKLTEVSLQPVKASKVLPNIVRSFQFSINHPLISCSLPTAIIPIYAAARMINKCLKTVILITKTY